MNLSPNWVDRLNTAGLPAIHWSSIGRMDATDIEIMAYAAEHAYVVLTHDLDFSAILAATQGTKPSVVNSLGQPKSNGHRGADHRSFATDDRRAREAGALLTVDPGRTRLNLLPLRSGKQ